MAKFNRSIDLAALADPLSIDSTTYNFQSGGKKLLPVGPHLLAIPVVVAGAVTWTTDVSGTAIGLPKLGMNLAIYNKTGALSTVTIGNVPSITSQAIGAFDSLGNVGVACTGNAWTYLSMGVNQWIISSSSNLVVYLMDDSTFITRES